MTDDRTNRWWDQLTIEQGRKRIAELESLCVLLLVAVSAETTLLLVVLALSWK